MADPLSIAAPVWEDRHFVADSLRPFPVRWQFGFARKYRNKAEQEGRREANIYLLELAENIKQHPLIKLGASDEDIQQYAELSARRYSLMLSGFKDFEQAYKQISTILVEQGLNVPEPKTGQTFETVCRRFADPIWWRRALRVGVNRHVEHEAIKAGMVGRRSAYVSDETLQRRQQQIRRNNQLLEWVEAENDQGYKATLAELSKAGVSNPENRKHELMTRIRGMEEEAQRKGMTCEFYTLTCPSRFHPMSGGRDNPKYDGSSPRDAQQYLVKLYAQIRAKLKRLELQPVGFRVAEPHKDGCPHWHLMLFIEKRNAKALRRVFREYALKDTPNENGAKKYRFNAKAINPNKGSAAGYIAKYIAKNVSMDNLGDFERGDVYGAHGVGASDGLVRSVAWAAVWGIRQFQQQGGERITVWRELRRLRDAQDLPECVKPLWRAADTGEYAQFLREALKRRIVLIREEGKEIPEFEPRYVPDENGEFAGRAYMQIGSRAAAILNRYGEPAAGAIRGLMVDGLEVVTRFFKWTFTYKRQGPPKVGTHKELVQHVETGVTHKQRSSKAANLIRAAQGMAEKFFYRGGHSPRRLDWCQ